MPPDPTKTRELKVLTDERPVWACRFDPTGRFVFAGGEGNWVKRWDIERGVSATLAGHDSWVRALAFQREGGFVFTGGYDGRVNCWAVDATVPVPCWTVTAHAGWVRSLCVSPDGRLLASAGNDNLVKLWSIADRKCVAEFAGHESHVYNAAFHPGGLHLASCDLKGRVRHWELASGKCLRMLDGSALNKFDPVFHADIGGARGMAFSGDGRYLACSGITEVTNAFAGVGKPVVVLFDWLTGQRKHALRAADEFQGVAWGVQFHPAGFVVGVGGGGGGGALWFWKPDEAKAYHTHKLPATARDMDLHPDGLRVAVAMFDKTVRVYEMS